MISYDTLKDSIVYGFKRFTGTPIETELRPYLAIAHAIQSLNLHTLNGSELASRARTLRASVTAQADGVVLERAMAESIAFAAEACRRTLGIEPYLEQLAAAIALCRGKVVQLQTGEGKTLAAALAAPYCAFRDGFLHVITANDYLARRDAGWMGPIFEALGLGCASISSEDGTAVRHSAYRADILYLTARELGFDYLRDGLARAPLDLVQRGFYSAIVDEADFILVDEARIPLVIAGRDGEEVAREEAMAADRLVGSLSEGLDFTVDPEGRKVSLTLSGQDAVEAAFSSGGMHEAEAAPHFARVHAALHAHRLLERDVDYIVKGGKAVFVDGFTGRVAESRQWPWGIHAALEAKEGLEIGPEGRLFGSITVQHLMGLYRRLAAMTATATPAAPEFSSAYGIGTLVIPPAIPSRRRDEPDAVFWTRGARLKAVVDEIGRLRASGRPTLVGTASIRDSEELAGALLAAGIDCVLLNAKHDADEARLVAAAGRKSAVTISTNMAGRGTDIRLDEDPAVRDAGGLCVIGTGRHESRRIDDQLRGRAARQGDPGSTRFFLSLEDGMIERYGVRELLPKAYQALPPDGAPDGEILDVKVAREIARAQRIIEGQNSRIRLALRKFSLIVELDRRYVRQIRDDALIYGRLPESIETALPSIATPSGRLEGEASDAAERIAAARPALVQAFLSRLDSAWADHLALAEDVREGISLVRYGSKDPGREYASILADAFEQSMSSLETDCLADCEAVLGSGLERGGANPVPASPCSTWTYVIEDDTPPGFKVGAVAGAAAMIFETLTLPMIFVKRIAAGLAALASRFVRHGNHGGD